MSDWKRHRLNSRRPVAILVQLTGNRNFVRALRSGICAQLDIDDYAAALKQPLYDALLIVHRHRRHVVIGDVHPKTAVAGLNRAHPQLGQRWSKLSSTDSPSSSSLSSVAVNVMLFSRLGTAVERYTRVGNATPDIVAIRGPTQEWP